MQGSEFKAQYSQKEKLGQAPVAHTCNPSYLEAEMGRIKVQGQPRQRVWETHLQNNQSKMDRRCGSKGREPALQAQSSKFKHQSHQRKKKSN
jgi:hypothetical protein